MKSLAALSLAPALALAMTAAPALADHRAEGEVTVTPTMPLPADAVWKHSFDAYEGEKGEENGAISRALWFVKTMGEHGVDEARAKSAVVIHGPSVFDVVKDARYAAKYGEGEDGAPARNPNHNNVAELIARGGEIWVCGVSAKHHKVGDEDLLPGVRMAPAAMIAHADLQRRGFSLNPY
ncbi:DsrE family protein [Altererythrobacter arenosus]|uniref:DsrE family protein n=1 Tax=Altererythrobacter arenosus TaxID=3032592 RepID=A0ABY8FTN3_9SPHN|nr:DsrE family protein [Altererythrobacter sp. CAU 1644]WFL78359.1 DsrE family protein [Altererythrobacter sp. CAU 1644]